MDSSLVVLCIITLTTITICIVAAYNIYHVGKDINNTHDMINKFDKDLFKLLTSENLTDKEYTMTPESSEHECEKCWFYFRNPIDGSEHCSQHSGLPLSNALDQCDNNK